MKEWKEYLWKLGKTKILILIGIIVLGTVIPTAAISHLRNQESQQENPSEFCREGKPPGLESPVIIDECDSEKETGRTPDVYGEWNYNQEEGPGDGYVDLPDEQPRDDNDQSSSEDQTGSGTDQNSGQEPKDEDPSDEEKDDSDQDDEEKDDSDGEPEEPAEEPWAHPWEEIGIDQGISDFFSNTSNPMTRKNFAKITGLIYEYYRGEEMVKAFGSTFSDTDDEWVLKSYNHSVAPEGEGGKFYPDRKITREEGAYILYLLLEEKGERYSAQSLWVESDDMNDISSFALEAMTFMDHHGILPRRSPDLLDPKKSLTTSETEGLFVNLQTYIKDFDRYSDTLERPKNLKAVEAGGTAGLRWDSVDNAEYYYVYEASEKDGPYFVLRDRHGEPLQVYWRQGEILQVTGLNEGSDYFYRVSAVINGIESSPSEPVKVTGTKDSKGEYADYEEHLMAHHSTMTIGERELAFKSIKLRENAQGELELSYFVNQRNSRRIREIEKDGNREDIRTLFGRILEDLQEEFGKDVTGKIIYQDEGLKDYPEKYEDNLIEPDPISEVEKEGEITYSVWFPYLTISIDFETGDYRHQWYMKKQEL